MKIDKPIALGRTAEIVAWENGQVLKLFYDWFPGDAIEYEAHIARAIYGMGIPIPEVGEIVEVNGRVGLEYERVTGVTMWQEIETKPWKLWDLGRQLAELQAMIHTRDGVEGIPRQRDRLEQKIREAAGLSAGLKDAALEVLAGMPGGNRLCHGDFHPGNVILSENGPVVIDWIDATVGNQLADVARTTIIAYGVRDVDKGLTRAGRWMISFLHWVYKNRYFQLSKGGEGEYQTWQGVVAAGRMSEGIEELEDWLRKQVEISISWRA